MSAAWTLHLILRNLILPPAAPLLLIGVALLFMRARPSMARAVAWVGVALLWALSTPFVAGPLLAMAQQYPALDLSQPSGAGAIVILGAGDSALAPEYQSNAPDGDTLQRIAYGALVAQATRLPILVSGGPGQTSDSVASVMANSLQRDFHCPVRWLEERSRNTHENAVFSAAILRGAGIGRIILVTSAAHMARSVAEFHAANLQVVPAPTAFMKHTEQGVLALTPSLDALARSHEALYELIGRAVR
jgi:uncharacterized SAM-binding protein YcdF (DUF218 family)